MIEKQPLLDQRIIHSLSAGYRIEVTSLKFLPLGADRDASVFRAEGKNQSYFIKIKRGHHPDIGEIAQLLYNAGIAQIIPPITTIQGQLVQYLEGFTLIVYPFVEGKDGFTQSMTDAQWIALGKTLRCIHEISLPASMQNRIRKETYSPIWQERLNALLPQIESATSRDDIGLKLLKFMKKHTHEIHRLADRAEKLAEQIKSLSSNLVLCHGDIHAGNVLLNGNGSFYLVDWDSPIIAPKERDLMFIGGGVANVWNKPYEETLFYKGYGKTEVNRSILAYYRNERIVEDIVLYAEVLLLSLDGGKDREEMYRQFVAMFEPQGVLDIALKTDEHSPDYYT